MVGSSRKTTIIVLAVLIVATLAFVLANAFQGSLVSWHESNAVGILFGPILHWLHDQVCKIAVLVGYAGTIHYDMFVRKCGHFVEYFALGVGCAALTCVFVRKAISPYLWADLLIVLAVAVTDEFVQLFVGRQGRVADVVLDFSGALVGIAVVLVVAHLVFKRAERRRERSTRAKQ